MPYATSSSNGFPTASQIPCLPLLITSIYPSQIALEIPPPPPPLANSAANIIHISQATSPPDTCTTYCLLTAGISSGIICTCNNANICLNPPPYATSDTTYTHIRPSSQICNLRIHMLLNPLHPRRELTGNIYNSLATCLSLPLFARQILL
jgi:hypothetical protein